jgi:hypothetical protein
MLIVMVNELCTMACTNGNETGKGASLLPKGEGRFFDKNIGKGVWNWESARIEVNVVLASQYHLQ